MSAALSLTKAYERPLEDSNWSLAENIIRILEPVAYECPQGKAWGLVHDPKLYRWYISVTGSYVTLEWEMFCPECNMSDEHPTYIGSTTVTQHQLDEAWSLAVALTYQRKEVPLPPDELARVVNQHDPTKVRRYSQVMVLSDFPAKTGQNVRGKLGKGYVLPDRPDIIYVVGQGWYGEWPVIDTDAKNRLTEEQEGKPY